MSHILLTGATGFIGSHLLESLLQQGFKVSIIKRTTSNTWRINHLIDQISIYDYDREELEQVFKEGSIDTVIHLATCYRKYESASDIDEMTRANIAFPSELLVQGAKYGVSQFINTGTYFEYDCSVQPVSESANLKPFNYYAATKTAFEGILKSYSEALKISTLRLFSPYGAKDNNKLIPMLIKKGFSGEKISLSEGFQKIDPIYVDDIVSAYLRCIDLADNETGYDVFNIGSGQSNSIRDIVSVIEEKLGRSLSVEWGEKSLNDYECVYADTAKARKYLGWTPVYSLSQGVEKTIEYYRGES